MIARLAALTFLLFAAPAIAVPVRSANAHITVLVDLSKTWHNSQSLARNRRLLVAVGQAIVDGQAGLPKPIQVTYRIIGANSLIRDEFYSTSFAPSLLAPTNAVATGNLNVFRERLIGSSRTPADPLPLTMLKLPPELRTEILGAIVAARRADALATNNSVRMMIILSDFVEDSQGLWQLNDSLKGYRIWLVGRALPEDAANSAALPARLRALEQHLEKRGAVVQTFEESALLSSPAAFAQCIKQGHC